MENPTTGFAIVELNKWVIELWAYCLIFTHNIHWIPVSYVHWISNNIENLNFSDVDDNFTFSLSFQRVSSVEMFNIKCSVFTVTPASWKVTVQFCGRTEPRARRVGSRNVLKSAWNELVSHYQGSQLNTNFAYDLNSEYLMWNLAECR